MPRVLILPLALALAAGTARPAAGQGAPAATPGLRGELIAQFDDAATKLVQLAEAIPQDKYTWRPGVGVRSVSEVLMHVTGGNYYVLSFAGVKAPAGTPEGGETTVTDRGQVLAHLKQSCDFVRATIRAASDADLQKAATMFGRPTTNRNVFLTVVTHAHEHLGQLIAYARTNGVVPPWSMPAAR
jgi:uncharacterized damage-inducible protein DinB